MRLLIQARGRTLDISVTRDEPEPDPPRDVDLYSSTERAGSWDHDQRQPIGYRRNE